MSSLANQSNSSLVKGHEYNAEKQELTLDLEGTHYVYENVPEKVYNDFSTATSLGQAFHSLIKDQYTYRKA